MHILSFSIQAESEMTLLKIWVHICICMDMQYKSGEMCQHKIKIQISHRIAIK